MSHYAFKAIGDNVRIYPLAKIVGAQNIEIGSNVIIDDFVLIIASGQTQIGNHVHIASFSSITGGGECCLEDFSGLASGVRIVTGSENFDGQGLTNPTIPQPFRAVTRSKVVVKAHAIVGANTVILPGVTIGTGAAVGACSLVHRDLDPWTVYFGVPARRLKSRRADTILDYERKLIETLGPFRKTYRDLP